jgi:ABC-type Mn2+/Zn2+ transport system permease subunit
MVFTSLLDFIEYPFLTRALITTICLSLTCGLLSPLVIAKRYAFLGSAVSHSTLLGLSIGIALSGKDAPLSLFFWTLMITLALSLFLAKATWRQALPSDTLIGLFFTGTMGLGTLVHSLTTRASGDLMSYLFGNVLLLTNSDVVISVIICLIIIPLILIPWRWWLLSTYDEDFAITNGAPAKTLHFVFVIVLTALIVSALKLSGTVLVNALLLTPGFFALSFARNIRASFIYSVLFSVFSAVFGLALANYLETPSGATLAVVQLCFLGVALIIQKWRSL